MVSIICEFPPFIILVNEFAVQPACDPYTQSEPNSRLEKFAPVDLTSWSATGGKWPVNHVRGQRWMLWYWCSGKCIIKDYQCTYMHSHPLKCLMSSLNLEYPGTFCLNCHVECFLTCTGWIVRVVIPIHKLQADWTLWYPIPTGVCQAYFRCDPFGVWLV